MVLLAIVITKKIELKIAFQTSKDHQKVTPPQDFHFHLLQTQQAQRKLCNKADHN